MPLKGRVFETSGFDDFSENLVFFISELTKFELIITIF